MTTVHRLSARMRLVLRAREWNVPLRSTMNTIPIRVQNA